MDVGDTQRLHPSQHLAGGLDGVRLGENRFMTGWDTVVVDANVGAADVKLQV